MQDADLTAQAQYLQGMAVGDNTFWFDVDSFTLIPADQPKPAPYGLGKFLCGDARYTFVENTGLLYTYDESTDYTDKIICVTVKTEDDNEPHIETQWVRAPE